MNNIRIIFRSTWTIKIFAIIINIGFKSESDSSFLSRQLVKDSKSNLIKFALQSSHKKRTENLGIDRDLKFCLQLDIYNNVPFLKQNSIVL